jgi:RNA polymerase sigma factor (sigma-70 family)
MRFERMVKGHVGAVMQHIRRLAGLPLPVNVSDRQLLQRFAQDREEAAFALLVQRHGPLVLGVCRRVLQHEQDAEDAFQATFLVLARKADSIRWQESVSRWLYEVARRLARKVKATRNRRCLRERDVLEPVRNDSGRDPAGRELEQVIDDELQRLPEKYRAPILLCCLQGRTQHEAARQLGWTVGTVRGRMWRGRDLLKARLQRRGLTISATLSAAWLEQSTAAAATPAGLAAATIEAGIHFTAGPVAAGLISAQVLTLTDGVLKAMFLTKVKTFVSLLFVASAVGLGASALGQPGRLPTVPDEQQQRDNPRDRKPDEPQRDGRSGDQQRDSSRDRRPDESQRAQRPDVPERGAGDRRPDGPQRDNPRERNPREDARPNADRRGQGDISAKVAAVAPDGSRLTLELPARGRERAAEPQKLEIVVTDQTKQIYYNVDRDGAKPTAGYFVNVWLVQGTRDTAAKVEFRAERANTRQAVIAGKLVAVGGDGKLLTVEPARGRGETRTVDIKITDKTLSSYNGVEKDGAKPTVGYLVTAWLEEGSQDAAARIQLGPEMDQSRRR